MSLILDVILNLLDGSQKFHKPNSETNYIHKKSNHSPGTIKQLPLLLNQNYYTNYHLRKTF